MRIAVLGAGGVGGLLAAALERAGVRTVLIAREETAAVLARDGLHVRSRALDAEWSATPAVATSFEAGAADVLVVATKATGLAAALERIDATPGLVLPLLNGLDHMAPLRARFGDAVVAAVIRVECDRRRTGEIVQTSPAIRVDVAQTVNALAEPVATAVRDAGLGVHAGAAEADVLWGKLVRLNALAATTSAYDRTLGEIRDDPATAAVLRAVVVEGAAAANAAGAAITAGAVGAELEAVHASSTSSMARDLAAGREPELDAICGAVQRACRRASVPSPALDGLVDRIADRAAHAGVLLRTGDENTYKG